MPEEIVIRRMTVRDVDAVHAIEEATFPTPWSRPDFEREMTSNPCARYLVALRDRVIVGFAGIHIILDEGHVTNIAVEKGSRGCGIGRKLTESLLQYASNLGVVYVTLEVRADNVPAQTLYRSLGFFKVGVRRKYYENGTDALIMVCDRMPQADPDFTEPETVSG